MKTIKGNILDLAPHFDIIVHGCNCFCTFGRGLALHIKNKYPEAYAADCATKKGDKTKLGTFSSATIGNLTVINAYTQYHWTGPYPRCDYNAIKKCFEAIKDAYPNKRIAIPYIGAGLAGGDWNVISKIIDSIMPDVTLVEYTQ